MRPIFKVLYRLYRLFSGLRHWGRRRFTNAGLIVLGALAFAAIMCPDTDNNVAYQGFAVLLCLLLLAYGFSWVFRARFSAMRLLPRFGTAGSPLNYTVQLKNLTHKTQHGLTMLEDFADPRPPFADWLAVQLADEKRARSFRFNRRRASNPFNLAAASEKPVPASLPGQEVAVQAELMPLRRGLLRLEGVTLARPDPLGLVRALAPVSLTQSVLILPKRYPLPLIDLPGNMKYQQGGIALASHVGQSEDFVALREYRPGDPMRHIHWRSWARAGKPVVKEFEDEFYVRHALVLDTFTDDPRSEAFEEAVSVAASFASTIQTQESLLDLLFVGLESYCFTGGRGLGQTDQMLEVLASVRPCHEPSFGSLERLVLSRVELVSGCICILLAWDSERQEFIRKLRGLGVPVLVLVVAERGNTKPFELGPMQDEPERFHRLEVGAIESGLAKLK